jgi:hypothetical protein
MVCLALTVESNGATCSVFTILEHCGRENDFSLRVEVENDKRYRCGSNFASYLH